MASRRGMLSFGSIVLAALFHRAIAGYPDHPDSGHDSYPQQPQACSFTLTSSGGISCPASQLDDGQIRLNGNGPTATFYFADGKITDSKGRGCIITEAPITQIQCDDGKAPAQGFSIGAGNVLAWNGSLKFSTCPATDTEYNIYVNPNFGQAKCIGVTLTASGCGAAPPPPPSPPPPTSSPCPAGPASTVTETHVVTSTVTSTVTVTTVTSLPCSSAPNTLSTVTTKSSCHECSTRTRSTTGSTSSTESTSSTTETGSLTSKTSTTATSQSDQQRRLI